MQDGAGPANINLNRAMTFGSNDSKKKQGVEMAAGKLRVARRTDSDMGRQLPPTGTTNTVPAAKKPKANPYARPGHMNVTVHQKDAYTSQQRRGPQNVTKQRSRSRGPLTSLRQQ